MPKATRKHGRKGPVDASHGEQPKVPTLAAKRADKSTTSKRDETKELPPAVAPSAYQRIHQVHFEELTRIWDGDRRIPTPASRKAWAEARNLNPVNVHGWWYRRRYHAKKLRITIPKDTYELEVGEPPVVPVKQEVKEEELPAVSLLANSDGTVVDAHHASDDTVFNAGLDGLSELTKDGSGDKNRAYTQVSSPPRRKRRIEYSPLPPSSPPIRSPDSSRPSSPQAFQNLTLWYEEDAHEALDISPTAYYFSALDNACVADYLGLEATMVSPCAFTAVLCTPGCASFGDDMNLVFPTNSSWCICGFRFAFDGSLLGLCSVCGRDLSE